MLSVLDFILSYFLFFAFYLVYLVYLFYFHPPFVI